MCHNQILTFTTWINEERKQFLGKWGVKTIIYNSHSTNSGQGKDLPFTLSFYIYDTNLIPISENGKWWKIDYETQNDVDITSLFVLSSRVWGNINIVIYRHNATGDTDWQDWLRLTIILIVLIITGGAEILRMWLTLRILSNLMVMIIVTMSQILDRITCFPNIIN